MAAVENGGRLRLRHAVVLCAMLFPGLLPAAGNHLTTPDSNSRIVVENAIARGGDTTLLFWTYPDIDDPGAGKPCPLNFYGVKLARGLPAAPAEPLASNVCGNALSRAGLLENGDLLVIAAERLQRWRGGQKIDSQSFGDLEATRGLGVDSVSGVQLYDITPGGDSVLGIPGGTAKQTGFPDASLVVLGLDANGKQRWRNLFADPAQRIGLAGLWASTGGAALVRVTAMAADAGSLAMHEHLHHIDSKGKRTEVVQLARDGQPDMQALMQTAQADLQRAFAMMEAAASEQIEKLDAFARGDGGFDVLLHRQAGVAGRAGHFLLRIGPRGELQAERPLTGPIETNGLQDWVDFSTEGNELVLLSRVAATQAGVESRRKTYMQTVISWIDTQTGALRSRLVPLDPRYLEAAMNAGDEQIQYLENLPGGTPVRLTTVGGRPVAVSIGKLSGKTALRFDEGTDDLLAYSEAADQGRAELAKAQAREQRKAGRAASKQQLNADLAAAVGMTAEEFAALGNRERKEAMIRSGNVDAMMAAAMKQAPSPQAMSAQPGNGRDTAEPAESAAFHMSVADAFKISGQGVVITGRVESGSVSVGDTICLTASRIGTQTLTVEGIEIFRKVVNSVGAGETPGILVNGVESGDITRNGADTLSGGDCGAAGG